MKQHHYEIQVTWTGNLGSGTSDYRSYNRDHEVSAPGKPVLLGSSDPAFRGDRTRYNPEDLLVASLSTCHMLWYLHLCSSSGIVVTGYRDDARGTMVETDDHVGHFTEVVLKPVVTVAAGADHEVALNLHVAAHHRCYIANSVKFPVLCQPEIKEESLS
jgi:organic hydroperoxide reductase OsmC/OhrA